MTGAFWAGLRRGVWVGLLLVGGGVLILGGQSRAAGAPRPLIPSSNHQPASRAGLAVGASTRRRHASSRTVVLHPRFRLAATGIAAIQSSGPYVLLLSPEATDQTQAGVLIDDRTGQQTSMSHAQCGSTVIGGPWLVFNSGNCGSPQQIALYPLLGGPPVTVPRPFAAASVAVGTHWVELDRNCDEEHLCPTYIYVNIQTGATRLAPIPPGAIIDLNSAQLAHKICRPLRIPNIPLFELPTKSVVFDGRFAISTGASGIFLERCGKRLHLRISPYGNPFVGDVVGANADAVVWQSWQRLLTGVFLPTLRRFVIKLPANSSYNVELGPRTLYLLNSNGQVWTARAPSPP
jgi:hypothetical protein